MATENITSISDKIRKVDKLYAEVNRGQSAEVTLRILLPLMEERLAQLLSEFSKCPPEIGPLLSLQARITEVWRIKEVLSNAVKIGLSAQQILERVTESTCNRT